ncbi:hypothetical protein BDV28DRAFT_151306 [Aspergillus coremiiformis]|uniref:Uncharacterized protein n=1 Tax=Aspergillus coremiiformis TaxID=138285 RepID=A0A5N6Z225_9EURO|nr:hypothetical protein BDV28DRAFT_151306 [Aspergillus coremiiformis]
MASISLILDVFQRHRNGFQPGSWFVYPLTSETYAEVLYRLRSDPDLGQYVECKLRYDYDPFRSLLTIRRLTPFHEIFCASVVGEISRQLDIIRNSNCYEAGFAKEIWPFASSRVRLPETTDDGNVEYITRDPDASFGHYKAHFPGVIIEICYSHKRRNIRDLADDYILCTDGSIKAVACLDIEYGDSKQATISIWRPAYRVRNGVEVFEASPEVNEEIFRTNDGLPSETDLLQLNLPDFGTTDLTNNYTDLCRHHIIISSQKLCGFLSDAELRQKTEERHIGSADRIRPGVQKRRGNSGF